MVVSSDAMMLEVYDVEAAHERIGGHVRRTPLLRSESVEALSSVPTWLKLECLQVTGSFKARGAANKVLGLDAAARSRGVVACSSGNHGLATAWISGVTGTRAAICVPEWVDPAKLEAIRATGSEAVVEGATYGEAEARSREIERERGAVFVHPFDDPDVIAGQGTIGLEVLSDLPSVKEIVVPFSGGGLIGGVGVALRARKAGVRLVGAYASRATDMARSVAAGHLVEVPERETMATALAGSLGPENHHSVALVAALVDEMVEVSEAELREAMRFAFREHRLVVEGGGAVGLAAAMRDRPCDGDRVVVVSGGNIALSTFQQVLEAS
jgi:threonine dehydratase